MPVLLRLRAWIVDVPAFLFGHANHRAMLLRACEKNTDILAFVLWNAFFPILMFLRLFFRALVMLTLLRVRDWDANALVRARLGC